MQERSLRVDHSPKAGSGSGHDPLGLAALDFDEQTRDLSRNAAGLDPLALLIRQELVGEAVKVVGKAASQQIDDIGIPSISSRRAALSPSAGPQPKSIARPHARMLDLMTLSRL